MTIKTWDEAELAEVRKILADEIRACIEAEKWIGGHRAGTAADCLITALLDRNWDIVRKRGE